MSNIATWDLLYSKLTGAEFAAAAASITSDTTIWDGVTIAAFDDARQNEAAEIRGRYGLRVIPVSFDLVDAQHSGSDVNDHNYDVLVMYRDASGDSTSARKHVYALAWAARYVIRNFVCNTGRVVSTRIDGVDYDTPAQAPAGALVYSATMRVAVQSDDTYESVIDTPI